MDESYANDVLKDRQRSGQTVAAILAGDPRGMESLYVIVRGFEHFLGRHLGFVDVLERSHEVFVTSARAILGGKLSQKESLVSFVYTVVRFHCYKEIECRVSSRIKRLSAADNLPDRRVDLFEHAHNLEKQERLSAVLDALRPIDREVIIRFYGYEQPRKQIEAEMNITPTQFRLRKSRALERARLIAQKGTK